MSRIGGTFRRIRDKKGKAFIPYVMAGDPDIERTRQLVKVLEECGADIIELGVPFSDPLADGPTIQKAAQRALSGGMTLDGVVRLVSELRLDTQIPIILMTYYNPVFKYGEERFVLDASAAGVDGVIVPDLPPEEAGVLRRTARKADFDTIFLLAPTSTEGRIRTVARASTGFIYYVSMTGITGAELSMDADIRSHISRIKQESGIPVGVGFGISTPEEASAVSAFADAVVIGSAIVKHAGQADGDLKAYLKSIRRAIV